MGILKLIDRDAELFSIDMQNSNEDLNRVVSSSTFLVIGAAGSIGQAVY